MKIYPVQNRIRPISFGKVEDIQTPTQTKGFLSVQNTDKLSFEKDLELTHNADAVQSNPLRALGYKFVKAYNILFSHGNSANDIDLYAKYYGIY